MDGGGGDVISGQSARMPAIITGSPRFAVGVGTLHLDFPSRMYLPASAGLSVSGSGTARWCAARLSKKGPASGGGALRWTE